MKFFLLTVALFAASAAAASLKVKRYILPGDPRYGSEYHLQHLQHQHQLDAGDFKNYLPPNVNQANDIQLPSTSYGVPFKTEPVPAPNHVGAPTTSVQSPVPLIEVQHQSAEHHVTHHEQVQTYPAPHKVYGPPLQQQAPPVQTVQPSYQLPQQQAPPVQTVQPSYQLPQQQAPPVQSVYQPLQQQAPPVYQPLQQQAPPVYQPLQQQAPPVQQVYQPLQQQEPPVYQPLQQQAPPLAYQPVPVPAPAPIHVYYQQTPVQKYVSAPNTPKTDNGYGYQSLVGFQPSQPAPVPNYRQNVQFYNAPSQQVQIPHDVQQYQDKLVFESPVKSIEVAHHHTSEIVPSNVDAVSVEAARRGSSAHQVQATDANGAYVY